MRIILAPSLALLAIIVTSPLLAYAQDPFTWGNTNDPFSLGGGGSTQSGSNTTLQIRSNTDWSGIYGDSTGSTTVDGHGNRDIPFSCSGTYSADFQKKGEGSGFLRLNIVQPFNNTVTKIQETARHGVPLPIGKTIALTKEVTDLLDDLDFSINQDSNSSNNAIDLSNQPLNTTLKMMIINPNGETILSQNSSLGMTYIFSTGFSNSTKTLRPDIAGKYTFVVKNLGNSTADLGITYGSLPSLITITTHNVTNTRTTTAQFGTVSVAGSC